MFRASRARRHRSDGLDEPARRLSLSRPGGRPSSVRRTAALGAAVLCASLVVGCTDSSGGDGGAGGRSSAGAQEIDLGAPIITQEDLPVPGRDNDHVTVGVLSLEVRGDLMVLNLVFTPHFSSVSKGDTISLYRMLGENSFGPALVDVENLKIYTVVNSMSSNTSNVKAVNGQPVYVWAAFPAPENDNTSFDVRIQTAWPVFTDIPVTK